MLLPLRSGIAAQHSASTERLNGHWRAEMTGDGKTFAFIFDFKVKGEALGGTVGIASQDREFPISGTIKGSSVSFKGFGLWTGVLQGDTLDLTRELDGGKKQHLKAHHTPAE